MVRITAVHPDGIGAELGLEPGDSVLAIDGRPVADLVDIQLATAGERMVLDVRKGDGELWELEIEKEPFDDLGLEFEHPEPRQCGNNCLFCFVHQLPRGMRRSLYIKDEDYRFSYLYGSYVTLTNIGEEEIQRVLEQRLSPLYVSVHATEEQLRTRLLGRRVPPILDQLRRLTAGGIEIHTQIVLCPGINDGAGFERTVEDLFALHPGVLSLAVVPVGLTGYRQRLPQLRVPTAVEAAAVLDRVHAYQATFLAAAGSRFLFAADELYLKAGRDFPPLEEYEDLAQVENGVGMIPRFRAEAAEALAEADPLKTPILSTFTGQSAHGELARFVADLRRRTGVDLRLHPIRNEFFSGHVSVAGLLTGRDVMRQLRDVMLGEVLLVPDVVMREGEDVFLDDVSLTDLASELGVSVRKIPATPFGLLAALEEVADDFSAKGG